MQEFTIEIASKDGQLMQEMYQAVLNMYQNIDNDDRASSLKINDCMSKLENANK